MFVRPPVRLSADSWPTRNILLHRHWLTIWSTRMYHNETMCRVYSCSNTTLNFDLKVKLKGFLTNLRVWPVTFLALTLAYHIWHMGVSQWDNVNVHSWSWYNMDTTLTCTQVQTLRFLTCLFVRPKIFVWFYIGLPYWTITIKGCVEYNHDPDATLNFDIKVKWVNYIVFWHVFVPKLFSRLT